MLTYLSGNIWASPAQTLVKTVNVVEWWHPSRAISQMPLGNGMEMSFQRG